MAVLKKIKFGEGNAHDIAKTVVTAKSGGVMSVAAPDNVSNEVTEDKDYQYELDVNVDGATLVKENSTLKVGTVPASQVSVDGTAAGITATTAQLAFKELKDKIDAVDGAAKSYTIIEKTGSLPSNVARRYKLQQTIGEGEDAQVTEVGGDIDILKDNSLLAAKLSTTDATWDGSAIVDGSGKEALVLVYKDANGVAQVIAIDVSAFLKEGEFKDGLAVSANGEVSAKLGQGLEFGDETGENKSIKVKIDSTSETFLTVGAGGVKLTGVQGAIDAAVNGLDVTDTAAAGQYVSSVSETDGKIAVERANVSDAVLNGYAKGAKPASTAIAATDDVKGAIAKLEHQIDDAKAAATTKVAKGADASHLTLTNSIADDGSVTYTIGESDIASKKDLDAEINARKAVDGQSGQTYAANSNVNYISDATSLNDADVKLDAALKTVSDKVNAIQYKVAGTTLEFFGIGEHA